MRRTSSFGCRCSIGRILGPESAMAAVDSPLPVLPLSVSRPIAGVRGVGHSERHRWRADAGLLLLVVNGGGAADVVAAGGPASKRQCGERSSGLSGGCPCRPKRNPSATFFWLVYWLEGERALP